MDFSQFGAGWNESQDNMERKRVELAKAFEEFKAQNPYATAADFQGFIDGASGGSNYVRGGAPSKDILASLATRNADAKAKQDLLDRINKESQIASLRQQVNPIFENAMMGGNREGLDDRIAEAYKENKDLVDLIGGQGFLNQFTQSKFDQNMFERTSKALPTIKQMIVSSGGQIDKDAISRATGINVDLLDGIIDQADTALKRDNHQWFLTNRRNLANDLRDWKKGNKGADVEDFFASLAGNTNGIPLDDNDKNSLIAMADGIDAQEQEDLLGRANVSYNAVEDALRADKELDTMVFRSDKDAIKAHIEAKIRRGMNPTEFNARFEGDTIPDGVLEQIADIEIAARETEQRAANEQRRETTRTQAVDLANKTAEERSDAFLRAYSGNTVDPVLRAAATYFASNLYLDGMTAGLITQSLSDYAKDKEGKMDYGELIQHVTGDLAGHQVMSLQDGKRMVREQYQDSQGMFKVESLDESLATEEQSIGSFVQNAQNDLDALINADSGEFETGQDLLNAVSQLEVQITNVSNASRAELVAREQNLLKWKRPGTRNWDNDFVNSWHGLSAPLQDLQAKVAELKKQAQVRIQEEAQIAMDARSYVEMPNRSEMLKLLRKHEIGDIVTIGNKQYEIGKLGGHQGRNQGGKRLIPIN